MMATYTDYFLVADDEAAFVSACKALSVWDMEADAPMTQAVMADGTIWTLDVIGTIYQPTGEIDADGQPVMTATPGFHFNVRWKGGAPLPDPLPDGIAIIDPPPSNPVRVFA